MEVIFFLPKGARHWWWMACEANISKDVVGRTIVSMFQRTANSEKGGLWLG